MTDGLDMQTAVDGLVEAVDWIDEDEVRGRAAEIQAEYDGLLGGAGAVYVLADRIGVALNDELRDDDPDLSLDIENIIPEMYDCELEATVESVYPANSFDGGRVRNILISDETGKTQLTLWDDDVEKADGVSEGDTIQIYGAYTRESEYVEDRYGCPAEIHMGSNSYVVDAETGDVVIDTRESDDDE